MRRGIIIGCLVVVAAAYTGALETDFASIIVLIIAYGILFEYFTQDIDIYDLGYDKQLLE